MLYTSAQCIVHSTRNWFLLEQKNSEAHALWKDTNQLENIHIYILLLLLLLYIIYIIIYNILLLILLLYIVYIIIYNILLILLLLL